MEYNTEMSIITGVNTIISGVDHLTNGIVQIDNISVKDDSKFILSHRSIG